MVGELLEARLMDRALRITALLAAMASLAACNAANTLSLPAASQATPTSFALQDDGGRPIAHTHVMRSMGVQSFVESLARRGRPLRYHGGPVQTSPAIYVVFWGFGTYGDPSGEAARLTAFLNAVGASSWLNTVTQYYQSGPTHIANPASQLDGTWYDNTNSVPLHPTDAQIRAEAIRLAANVNVYSANAAYIVATPNGHNIKGFPRNFCAYHGDANASGSTIPYTNLPYMTNGGRYCGANSVNGGAAGKLDGVTIVGGHELAETQTDPASGGWWDSQGNEIGDKCAWRALRNTSFGSFGTFPTQPLWSNASGGCAQ